MSDPREPSPTDRVKASKLTWAASLSSPEGERWTDFYRCYWATEEGRVNLRTIAWCGTLALGPYVPPEFAP